MGKLLPLPEEEDDEDVALLIKVLERRRHPLQMKMKLAPYAMYCVFSGAGSRGHALGAAYMGLYFVRILFLSSVAEVAAFWGSIHTAVQCICYATTALVICVFIRWYMAVDGVYHVEFIPPPQLMAAMGAPAALEVEQLPLPPPEMDMC
ncbi:unnamed protein product [Urochloa humidicola]